jgi:hypothetical protein
MGRTQKEFHKTNYQIFFNVLGHAQMCFFRNLVSEKKKLEMHLNLLTCKLVCYIHYFKPLFYSNTVMRIIDFKRVQFLYLIG